MQNVHRLLKDVIVWDLFFTLVPFPQRHLFQQNARGTGAPPRQPLCEQNVWWGGVYWSGQKIRSQQEPRGVLHLRGLPHHSCFQREGSEAHADASKERRAQTGSEWSADRTGRPAHGRCLSLWDVGLFPLHHRRWVTQTLPPAFLFQRDAVQSAELRGYAQVWQLAAQWDLAAWQRAMHHVWVQKLQVGLPECVTCHPGSIKVPLGHWQVNFPAGRMLCRICLTGPSIGPSVKPCSIRSSSTASGTIWGLKSYSGNSHVKTAELHKCPFIHFCINDAQIQLLIKKWRQQSLKQISSQMKEKEK